MSTDFRIFFTAVFSMKFATKCMSYISSTLALACKTQKTETGKILLHVTQ